MTLIAVAPADASARPAVANGHYIMTDYVGSFDQKSAGPQAYLVRQSAAVLGAHFHEVDQFQVVVSGRGALGREPAKRGLVHYTDAYTPYGPIEADTDGGLEYFTLRREATIGANFMPDAREKRGAAPTDHFTVSVPQPSRGDRGLVELKRSSRGAAAFAVSAVADAVIEFPAAERDRDGYAVIFAGTLVVAGDTCPAGSVVAFSALAEFAGASAGDHGVELVLMTFAGRASRPVPSSAIFRSFPATE